MRFSVPNKFSLVKIDLRFSVSPISSVFEKGGNELGTHKIRDRQGENQDRAGPRHG